MKSTEINDWLQVIGTFGVIASLVFVGLQLRQTHEIALSNNYQARTAIIVERNTNLASNPHLISARMKANENRFDDLTAEERMVLSWTFYDYLLVLENNHFQHQAGYLSDEHWERNERELSCNFEQPHFREMVYAEEFRESFGDVIRQAKRNALENPSGCWE